MSDKLRLRIYSFLYWTKENPAKTCLWSVGLVFLLPVSVVLLLSIGAGMVKSEHPIQYILIVGASVGGVLVIGWLLRKLSDWLVKTAPVKSLELIREPTSFWKSKNFLRAVELTVAVTVAKIIGLYLSR